MPRISPNSLDMAVKPSDRSGAFAPVRRTQGRIPRATTHWVSAVSVFCALLSGCGSVAPRASVDATPVSDSVLYGQTAWWDSFNDPLLSQLVRQALQANSSVRSARAALQQARALRDVRQASLAPSLNASASASRSQTEFSDAVNGFTAGLDASWEIDVFGGKRSSVNASEADALAARASLRDVQVSLAAEVALTYIQLRGSQAQLGIAQRNLTSQQETLQITEWRAQAGLITSLEVAQAQSAREQTAAQVPALQSSIANAQHSLAVLTGQRPGDLIVMLSAVQAVPQASPEMAKAIPADTLRQRADVRAAEHRIRAALARVDAADAARYPGFNLGGSLSLNALTLAGLTNGATLASRLLASVSVPLFDGGAAKAQVLAQEAALEQARASYQTTVLTALKDVADALVALKYDAERLTHLERAAEAADNAALLAQNRFASGVIDFQTVLQTQRTLLSTQDSVATVRASLSADQVRLVKALGGGWQATPAKRPD